MSKSERSTSPLAILLLSEVVQTGIRVTISKPKSMPAQDISLRNSRSTAGCDALPRN